MIGPFLIFKSPIPHAQAELADNAATAGKLNGSCRWDCNHDPHHLELHTAASGYFKPGYLAKHPLFPHKCTTCSVLFVDKPKIKVLEGEYKIAQKRPVYMCVNAGNSLLPCLFAHCIDCHNKDFAKASEVAGGKRDHTAMEEDEGRKKVSKRSRIPKSR